MRGALPGFLGIVLAAATPAAAQVTVNPGALDLLPSRPTAPTRGPARSVVRPIPPPANEDQTSGEDIPIPPIPPALLAPAGQTATQMTTQTPARPQLPTVPPAIAALPPPPPVPEPRAQTPPNIPVAADAPGQAMPLTGGLRVTFGPDRQDLNPSTEAALRDLARRVKDHAEDTVSISAYAAGAPEDPSTARRLSLGRALAARAVLIDDGVASNRIYPRALGAAGGQADPDRVDVIVNAPPGAGGGANP